MIDSGSWLLILSLIIIIDFSCCNYLPLKKMHIGQTDKK